MIVPLQVLRDGGAQKTEWLPCSHSAVHDGKWGESRGVTLEVHDHLHCFERVQLQVVKTAPDSQLLNLLSVVVVNPFAERKKKSKNTVLLW